MRYGQAGFWWRESWTNHRVRLKFASEKSRPWSLSQVLFTSLPRRLQLRLQCNGWSGGAESYILIVAHADAAHEDVCTFKASTLRVTGDFKLIGVTTLDITKHKLSTSRSLSTRTNIPAVCGQRRTNKKNFTPVVGSLRTASWWWRRRRRRRLFVGSLLALSLVKFTRAVGNAGIL